MRITVIILMLAILTGCESTGNKNELANINKNLRQEIEQHKAEIGQLKGSNALLNKEIDDLKHVISVLDTEKTSRVKESSQLRGQVRQFVQNQVDGFKQFLVAGNLLDYVGGELVERANIEEKPLTVVDLSNPMPSNGVLTGIGAYVIKSTSMRVKLLRNIENNLVIIWESPVIDMLIAGPNRHEFANSIGVEKGDIIAYEFPTAVGVGYDTGTGDARYTNDKFRLGQSIQLNSLLGSKFKRSYAMGVYGLLNQ